MLLSTPWPESVQRYRCQPFLQENSADNAGSVLYGGAVDNCKIHVNGLNLYFSSGDVFDMLFQYEADTDYSTTSKISSDPLHICVCKTNLPDCSGSHYYNIPYPVYPGETFQLSVPTVTVGQRHGTVFNTVRSTAITSSIDSHQVNLLDYQISNIQTTLAPNSSTLCFHCLRRWS